MRSPVATNCLIFALRLYFRLRRRWKRNALAGRMTPVPRIELRQSYIRGGPFHVLVGRGRQDGTVRVVSYKPGADIDLAGMHRRAGLQRGGAAAAAGRGAVIPVDTATGLQSGSPVHTGQVDVLVGYLVTHADGYEVRMPPDRTRAELYAVRQRATLEPMYVRRPPL